MFSITLPRDKALDRINEVMNRLKTHNNAMEIEFNHFKQELEILDQLREEKLRSFFKSRRSEEIKSDIEYMRELLNNLYNEITHGKELINAFIEFQEYLKENDVSVTFDDELFALQGSLTKT